MDTTLTKSDRENLKAIYRLTRTPAPGSGAESVGAAHTGDLAGALGVTPGTATTAVKRLRRSARWAALRVTAPAPVDDPRTHGGRSPAPMTLTTANRT